MDGAIQPGAASGGVAEGAGAWLASCSLARLEKVSSLGRESDGASEGAANRGVVRPKQQWRARASGVQGEQWSTDMVTQGGASMVERRKAARAWTTVALHGARLAWRCSGRPRGSMGTLTWGHCSV